MLRNSLRFRVIFAFCMFCVITGVTYTSFVLFSIITHEDAVFNNRLALEISDFTEQYSLDKQTPLPNSAYIKGYIGLSSLSEDHLDLIKNRPDGIFEINDLDYHIGISSLPETEEKLFIFYNTSRLEVHDERAKKLVYVMFISFLLFLVIALLFSYFVTDRAIKPVIYLANIIKDAGILPAPKKFSNEFYHDEIGFLARILEDYLVKMEETIESEKRFASDVSHELRTPVTTIKGATEVIKRNSNMDQKEIMRPVARIERAIKDMENLIETFLTLSRFRDHLPEEKRCSIFPIIREVIEQNNYLLNRKEVTVSIEGENKVNIMTQPVFFKIIISNLIRNAFQYTRNGCITVQIDLNKISITDTGVGMLRSEKTQNPHTGSISSHQQGVGIGLSIVKRLCDKAGWCLDIQSHDSGGTSVTLLLNDLSPIRDDSPD